MNLLIYLGLIPMLAVLPNGDDEIDSSQDKIKVEKAVVAWADATFYSHSNYKFENFRAEYSESYFIAVMRAKAYKERVSDLENQKSTGKYKGTQAEYEKELITLKDAYTKIQNEVDTHPSRADYYLIHFWTNIQTTDGITVYYEHIMKLDNNYQVIEATINSAIGKKDENTQPIYKKDMKVDDTKKKVDSAESNNAVPADEKKIEDQSTQIESEKTEEVIDDSKKKKKKKKKK